MVLGLLGLTRLLRARLDRAGRVPVPDALFGGCLGMLLGPSMLGLLPMDERSLEIIVYHGLALTFLAIGLRPPGPHTSGTDSVRSLAFAIPLINLVQGALGLSFVLFWSGVVEPMHPGFGWLLPLGFSQGPGQAMSLGAAFEQGGMRHGAQLGLAFAAIGFGWSVFIGVPLIAWGRARGFVAPRTRSSDSLESVAVVRPGPLLMHLAGIATLYVLTFAILLTITSQLSPDSEHRPMIWGFHFLVAILLALPARTVLTRTGLPTDSALLGRVAAVVVDVTTVAAISAVQLEVVAASWVPLLLLTSMGGMVTLAFSLAFAWRTVEDEPFEHAVTFFGTMTGTLPTGLALLRVLDPHLEGPAGRAQTLGSVAGLPLAIPLLLIFLPRPIRGWPETFPETTWSTLGLTVAYGAALFATWAWLSRKPRKP